MKRHASLPVKKIECKKSIEYTGAVSITYHYCAVDATLAKQAKCINDRLRNHANLMCGSVGISIALLSVQCAPIFKNHLNVAKYKDQSASEICESFLIQMTGNQCVSSLSIELLDIETAYHHCKTNRASHAMRPFCICVSNMHSD